MLLYVDDILAQVDKEEVERLRVHLRKRFGEVQFEIGEKLSYLGMQINIRDEGMMVDMSFYIKKAFGRNDGKRTGISGKSYLVYCQQRIAVARRK